MRQAGRMAWMAVLLLLAGHASAQRVEGDVARAQGAYEAEVPVRTQGESERNSGFARAMAQVLGKLSGDRASAWRPGVGDEMRRARDYVKGYDYRQDEGISSISGAPSYTTTLVVRFDQAKIDGIVAALGLPVWPQPRPKPVVWLAIDDGRGPRLVGLQQNNVARPLTQRAIERGYRLGLPSGGAAEQAAVGAIWRGDTAAIARISARYSPPMQLIGKLYRSKGGWTADWIFVDKGRVLAKWSETAGDARRALATGADGTADALTRRYARAGSAGTPGTYRMVFTGLDSSDDYIRLSAELQRISVVKSFAPVRATPEGLEADVALSTGLSGFRRLLNDDVVVPEEGDSPVYRVR